MATNENLPPNVIKQLAKELKNLDETPPEGIKVGVNDDNFSFIYADIEGPAGTPYANGVFRMKLILSHDFPQSPPKESALNEQAGKMLLENYEEYARHARLYTGIHAPKPKSKFKTGGISESTTALNVEQANTSVKSIDQKNAVSDDAPQLPSLLAPKPGNNQDQPTATLSTEPGVSGLKSLPVTHKEVGLAKVLLDKKKMDARKKSLKRL
ncbi:Ubiquitin-conjugating enzyme E2 22 [Forsythia ovata]|uniref:Ubiquitin-conjugating enzyme E2 22 n=1 Tax=Forsythia ovata TaxID=205694 RepID=A0ABD1SMR0_9LAMI